MLIANQGIEETCIKSIAGNFDFDDFDELQQAATLIAVCQTGLTITERFREAKKEILANHDKNLVIQFRSTK